MIQMYRESHRRRETAQPFLKVLLFHGESFHHCSLPGPPSVSMVSGEKSVMGERSEVSCTEAELQSVTKRTSPS